MAKGTAQLQEEGDKNRRKSVDAKNKQAAAKDKSKLDALADTPLTAAEIAFCVYIESRMNNGRRVEKPCPADILRYSKLRGRMDIKAEDKGGE